MSMKDVWKSAIETSGEQFVTVDLTQMMPGQHVAKLDTLENLLVSNYLLWALVFYNGLLKLTIMITMCCRV